VSPKWVTTYAKRLIDGDGVDIVNRCLDLWRTSPSDSDMSDYVRSCLDLADEINDLCIDAMESSLTFYPCAQMLDVMRQKARTIGTSNPYVNMALNFMVKKFTKNSVPLRDFLVRTDGFPRCSFL